MHQIPSRLFADAELARMAVAREMRTFRTPFPACDVHFTRLARLAASL